MTIGRILTILGLVALLQAVLTPPAHANLDPGTGSYTSQPLLAATVELAFAVKVFWSRIKGFFAKILHRDHAQTEGVADD